MKWSATQTSERNRERTFMLYINEPLLQSNKLTKIVTRFYYVTAEMYIIQDGDRKQSTGDKGYITGSLIGPNLMDQALSLATGDSKNCADADSTY